MTTRNLSIRLSAEGEEALKRALRDLGKEGQAALSSIERGSAGASVGLLALDRTVGALKAGVAGLAAGVTVGAIAQMGVDAVNTAVELQRSADAAGISVEQYQRMGHALESLGLRAGEFADVMGEFLPNLAEAAQGGNDTAEALEGFGVSVRDAAGGIKSTDQIILDLADALAKIPSQTERAGVAAKLFGEEAGPRVALALGRGRQAIEDAGKQAAIFERENIDAALASKKEWSEWATWFDTTWKNTVLGVLREVHLAREGFRATEDRSLERLRYDLANEKAELAELQATRNARVVIGGAAGRKMLDDQIAEQQRLINQLEARIAFLQGPPGGGSAGNAGASTNEALNGLKKIREDLEKELAKVATPAEQIKAVNDQLAETRKKLDALRAPDGSNKTAIDDAIAQAELIAKRQRADIDQKEADAAKRDNAPLQREAEQRREAVATIERQIELLAVEREQIAMTDRQRAISDALLKAEEVARRANIEVTQDQAEAIQIEAGRRWDAEQAAKAHTQALDDGRRVLQETLTPQEQHNARVAELTRLHQEGAITASTYQRAVMASADDMREALKKQDSGWKELGETIQGWGRSSARALADWASGSEASLARVGQAIERELWERLFFKATSPAFDFFAKALESFGASLFGTPGLTGDNFSLGTPKNYVPKPMPPRDSGGPGSAGQPYLIGRGAQPEIFVPDVPGQFYPRGQYPAGMESRDSGGPGRAGQPYRIGIDAQPELFIPNGVRPRATAPATGAAPSVAAPVSITIIDQRSGDAAPAQVTERNGPDGSREIEILITDTVGTALLDGRYDIEMRAAYGLRPGGA
ncbi:hypothetical protein N825_25430 [Skermanella stibiiresistens SB22]|uniref:Phage tail tape measure protein domain-containing protein n=1 Tax=Skermanella stibiiresistens SB22 TaxID=1385369 RepID=W9GSP8_9PROT|nr:phage tail tape measure protein [Skermanella stibiiresistens]EWY36779.1 hypothetical protein N825_25430 [Skermanella stibiiresistens SB22]